MLTPASRASAGRQNSYPQIDKLRNRVPKAKRDERRAADDPLYSVSLGTESDDESGRPDPTWWMRSPRGQRKRERDAPRPEVKYDLARERQVTATRFFLERPETP